MKRILLPILAILMAGCASVSLYSPTTGQPMAKWSGTNGTGVSLECEGVKFKMETMDNSTSTSIVSHTINGLTATLAGAFIASTGIPGAAPGTTAAMRAFVGTVPHVVNATKPTVPKAKPHPTAAQIWP